MTGLARRYGAFGLVLLGVAVGLAVVVVLSRPFLGCAIVALAFIGGALARSVLHDREAGLLVNRTRSYDVAVMAGLGFAILLLTLSLRAAHQS